MVVDAEAPWSTMTVEGVAFSVKVAVWETTTFTDADSTIDPLVAVIGMV